MNALLVAALLIFDPAAQGPVRETPSLGTTGLGVIKGRVTERDTGQPLARFRVSVSKEPVLDETSATVATVVTDSNGNYELAALPPGAYVLTARPPQFVASHLAEAYGYDAPLAMAGPARITPVVVKSNGILEAHFTLRRSLAIEGGVTTEEGDPLAGVLVSLERLDRRAVRSGLETDDRGFYRHFGLPPGRYRLCVASAVPPAKDSRQPAARENLFPTCYPAESDPAHAIELTAADVRNADIVMRSGRRFTVSGELRDSGGGLLDAGDLSFVEENARPRRSLRVQRMRPGRFTIDGVEPGTYILRADVAADAAAGRLREYASMEVVVGNEDVTGLALGMRRSAVVGGVVTFEGGVPESRIPPMTITIQADAVAGTEPSEAFAPRQVRENLTFDLPSTSEPVRLGLGSSPAGWIVKSILYHGRDVTDEAAVLESSGDPRAIEIALTNSVGYISGRAVGAPKGRQVVVLAFRADRVGVAARPDASGGSSLPVAASAPADEKSTFNVGPLAPGEYLVAAVDRNQWFDASLENRAATVERILPRAERVVVHEGQPPQIVLRIVAVR